MRTVAVVLSAWGASGLRSPAARRTFAQRNVVVRSTDITGTKFEEEDETKNPQKRPGHQVRGMAEIDPETAAKMVSLILRLFFTQFFSRRCGRGAALSFVSGHPTLVAHVSETPRVSCRSVCVVMVFLLVLGRRRWCARTRRAARGSRGPRRSGRSSRSRTASRRSRRCAAQSSLARARARARVTGERKMNVFAFPQIAKAGSAIEGFPSGSVVGFAVDAVGHHPRSTRIPLRTFVANFESGWRRSRALDDGECWRESRVYDLLLCDVGTHDRSHIGD